MTEPEPRLGPFTNHPQLDDVAHRFFRQFSRLEYALKATGKLVRKDGPAEASWAEFSDLIDKQFSSLLSTSEPLSRACDYILSSPPKKQVARAGDIAWSDAPPHAKSTTELVHRYVCRVRNNLFHGGKFNAEWFDPERSKELIEHSITILEHSIRLSPDVLAAYEN